MAVLYEDVRVKYSNTYSEANVAFRERTIGTLQILVYRYLEKNDTLSYIEDLQKFVDVIHSRINMSIELLFKDVANADFFTVLYKQMKLRKIRKPNFKIFHKVGLALAEHKFQKWYNPHYSQEIFLIQKINTLASFPTYFLISNEKILMQSSTRKC